MVIDKRPLLCYTIIVRGKNYEALVVSPPKGFETPPDKISKKLLTSITSCAIINTEIRKRRK